MNCDIIVTNIIVMNVRLFFQINSNQNFNQIKDFSVNSRTQIYPSLRIVAKYINQWSLYSASKHNVILHIILCEI